MAALKQNLHIKKLQEGMRNAHNGSNEMKWEEPCLCRELCHEQVQFSLSAVQSGAPGHSSARLI